MDLGGRIKLAVLTTSYPQFRGDTAGVFVHTLVRHLQAAGYVDPTVVAPHGPGLARKETVDGVPVRRFRYGWPSRLETVAYGTGIPTNLARKRIARLMLAPFMAAYVLFALARSHSADMYHAHWSLSGLVAALCKELTGKPFVVTIWGSDVNLARRWWPLAWLNRIVFSRADRIITLGSSFRNALIDAGIPRERIVVIPSGVDPAQFAAVEPGPPSTICFVGRLSPEKRVDLLIDAFAGVRRNHANARLVIVGDGALRSELEARANGLGLGDAVEFTGVVPHETLPEVFARCGVFCLVSSREGLPHSLLEAMAAGLGVVATDVGSVAEVVRTGQTGILLGADVSCEKVAEALCRLIAEPEPTRRMGQAAREFVSRDYAWTKIAEETNRVYRTCLQEKSALSPAHQDALSPSTCGPDHATSG